MSARKRLPIADTMFWDLKKISYEKGIRVSDVVVEAYQDYIEKNKRLLNEKIVLKPREEASCCRIREGDYGYITVSRQFSEEIRDGEDKDDASSMSNILFSAIVLYRVSRRLFSRSLSRQVDSSTSNLRTRREQNHQVHAGEG
jgi:hypothetical protein